MQWYHSLQRLHWTQLRALGWLHSLYEQADSLPSSKDIKYMIYITAENAHLPMKCSTISALNITVFLAFLDGLPIKAHHMYSNCTGKFKIT